MPDFKTLVKDFYQSYDPEAYSEEVSDELVKEYSSDPDKFLTDFYQSYDPDAYSEESNVEILKEYNLYNSKKKKTKKKYLQKNYPKRRLHRWRFKKIWNLFRKMVLRILKIGGVNKRNLLGQR
jgi:uncharacterized lipoprotein YddW (UPF0748 family)